MTSGASSRMKWMPGTVISSWFGQRRQKSRCAPTRMLPGSALRLLRAEKAESGVVKMANHAVADSGRLVDWLHLAGPRYLRSEDDQFFAPLEGLQPGESRVYR